MLSKTLNEYYGKGRSKLGPTYLGIEVELEGKNLLAEGALNHWSVVPEGSLRNGGVEFVTALGTNLDNLPKVMEEYEKVTRNAKISPSIRTSVHIHVSVQLLTLREIYTVITAWFLIEDLLVKINGPTRVGNLFCLRNRDAEGIQRKLIEEITKRQYFRSWSVHDRYAALNLAALAKCGTLEFRFIKGIHKSKEIEMWARALVTFVNRAKALGSPRNLLEIYENFMKTPKGFEKFVSYLFLGNGADFIPFLRSETNGVIETDNENLSFALVLSSSLESQSKSCLNLNIVEDIDPIEESPKAQKKSWGKEIPSNLNPVTFNPFVNINNVQMVNNTTNIPHFSWDDLAIETSPHVAVGAPATQMIIDDPLLDESDDGLDDSF